MARLNENGRTHQILRFIDDFTNEHGFSPTIREIGQAVGLRSNSTTAGYLDRMQKAGLISSSPGSARSIHIVRKEEHNDGLCESTLRCTFRLPAGTQPMSVIAMVSDDGNTNMRPVQAEKVEVIQQTS